MKFFQFSYAMHFKLGTQQDDMKALADELILIYSQIGNDMLMDIMKTVGVGVMKTAAA